MLKPAWKFSLALWLSLAGLAQVANEANKEYRNKEGRERVAQSLDSGARLERLRPADMIPLLGIKPGAVVADIGAGTGMMLPFLVEAVGPSGRVLAEDIQQDFLNKAEARIKTNNWSNVTTILGTDRNPNLPEAQLDLAFILDAYHHFDYPAEMLAHIARSLKPDGRIAVADFYRTRRGPQDKDMRSHVRADRDEVIREIEANGFQLEAKHDHASNQYVLLFRKK